MGDNQFFYREGKKSIVILILFFILLFIAAPTISDWISAITNSDSNQNNNPDISHIENENVEPPEKEQPTKENNEIVTTEFSSQNDFPIDMSQYLESGYITNFTKYNKDGKTYVFHEFSTGGDGKQGLGNNKQGLYCVDTKQWVLADITYDYYKATWDVYYIDDGKLYNFFEDGIDISTDGFTYFPNCGAKIAEAVQSLGLSPIDTAKDEATYIEDINEAFNLIGYTPK